jgi:hypothetical protein
MMQMATFAVSALTSYLAVGVLFAVAFAFAGVGRIDPLARQGTVGFRLLILPGAAAFWPLLLVRWWRGTPPPEESNPHRDLARAGGRD